MTLTDIMGPVRTGADTFVVTIPDGWQQGRGAFGGLVLGALVRCIELSENDPERSVRSLTASFAGPVLVGSWTIQVVALRRGSGVSTIRASLISGQEVLVEAVAVLGRQRPDMPRWQELVAPTAEQWRDLPVAPMGPPIAPVFTQNLEYRVTGPLPFIGIEGAAAEAAGWVRPRDAGPARGAAYLTALIDAWWPAAAPRFAERRPFGTLAFTAEIIGDFAGLDPDAPLRYRARAPVTQHGYVVEFRELWGSDGRLLALNQQTFAIIK